MINLSLFHRFWKISLLSRYQHAGHYLLFRRIKIGVWPPDLFCFRIMSFLNKNWSLVTLFVYDRKHKINFIIKDIEYLLKIAYKGSRPYQSDNSKCQIDVMFLTLPPTYGNIRRCSLYLENVYMLLLHNVKGLLFKPTHPLITSIWRFALSLGYGRLP